MPETDAETTTTAESAPPKKASAKKAAKKRTKKVTPKAIDPETGSEVNTDTTLKTAEDSGVTSIHDRLVSSGYVLNEDQISGDRWFGESVQCSTDPARQTAKQRTRVTSIAEVPPRKGFRVEPKGGEPFAISEEFDKDSKVEDWFAVIDPSTGKPLLQL